MSIDETLAGPMADELDQRRRWQPRTAFAERTSPESVVRRCDPEEPVFVLRAHDGTAVRAIGWYVQLLRVSGQPEAKVQGVIAVARAFKAWPDKEWPSIDFVSDETAWRQRHRIRTAAEELAEGESVLNRAADDEPVFVLRARDPLAVMTVLWWAHNAVGAGGGERKYNAALEIAMAIERWRGAKGLVATAAAVTEPLPSPVVAETPAEEETAVPADTRLRYRIEAIAPVATEVRLAGLDGVGNRTLRWSPVFIERFALAPGDIVVVDPASPRAFVAVEKPDGQVLAW